ncbi:MAG TPA: ATP synthase F1 subunit delta [Fimbriimonadaceae bacterium]|nr:ATP synthase F1 subunit delta [Fimbriimonadaceae bacterium]
MESRVAKRYARALFNAARRLDVIESVEDDLQAIVSLSKTNERFHHYIYSPHVGRDEKVKIAERIFSDRTTALTMQMLRLLLEKRRETEIEPIREHFIKLRREEGRVLFASITSAEPLHDEDRRRLIEKLESKTGKRVEAEYKVDPALMGGLRVAYGNYVLDGSIRGSLARLRDQLKYDLLKQTP